jgi:hypothetical protein
MCVSDKTEIETGVLSYLLSNPIAGDTLEGVVEWWLLEQKITHTLTEVRDVLDELTARKLILKSQTSDTRVHYRIDRRKEEDIRELIKRRP